LLMDGRFVSDTSIVGNVTDARDCRTEETARNVFQNKLRGRPLS
jgi:hypothetical protein